MAVSAERRASRPQQAQHVVGVNAGGVHREGHQHDRDPKRKHAALRERLGADVRGAQERQPEAVDQHRVAALGDQPVDRDDEDAERHAPAGEALSVAPAPAAKPATATPAPAPASTIGFE